jgi:hypothetical protein
MNEFNEQGEEHGTGFEPPAAEAVGGAKPVAFCQNCGRPLDEAGKRVVGPAVYCEPCLHARLGGRPAAGVPGGDAASWSAANPSSANWTAGGWTAGSAPNPGLAALLGFIPGVGAMYNEQYAKGFVHLAVFVVLVSLSHAAGIFTLLVFGWEAYMVVEAHHTARARRDGTLLPNPFGLNEVGERLGFARTWPAPGPTPFTPPGQQSQGPAPAGWSAGQPYPGPMPPNAATGGWTPTTTGAPPSASGPAPWGAPAEGFELHATVPPTSFPGAHYGTQYRPVGGDPEGFQQGYGQGYVPPMPPYAAPYAPVPEMPVIPPQRNRFPAGAVWLIGLGTLFLLSTTGIFETMLGWSLAGFVLIGLAVWVFVMRMTRTGPLMGDDGTPGYMLRVVRALWPAVWIGLTGVLLLLNEFDLVPWKRSWPLYIILAGVMTLLQRAALNAAARAMQFGVPPAGSIPVGSAYSVVPPAEAAKDSSSNEGVR